MFLVSYEIDHKKIVKANDLSSKKKYTLCYENNTFSPRVLFLRQGFQRLPRRDTDHVPKETLGKIWEPGGGLHLLSRTMSERIRHQRRVRRRAINPVERGVNRRLDQRWDRR
jgi:hypothetical protein